MEEYENIKSEKNFGKSIAKYVLKDILFSFLSEKQKLEIIIYNKDLLNKLDISIEDYKRISKRYRVGERNGKGKEYYYNGELKYKGEYLNGKRNGKGKEYNYYGELEYEGEYLNGKRNGKGKEYYNYDKIKFKGEYLNGKRWNGKFKVLNYFHELEYEGYYINGVEKKEN